MIFFRTPPKVSRFFTQRSELLAIFSLLLIFLTMELAYPRFPGMLFGTGGGGLFMDVYLAAQILDLLKENSFWDLFWSGRLPCIRTYYHSTLMAYLFIPFLKIFGRNWMVAKHWHLFWAALTLLFSYGFVRSLIGRGSALLALVLLTIHPTFVMGVRMGSNILSHMQFFSMGALCFLSLWWARKKTVWLCLALFFLGLGMSTNLWFYWIVGALAVAAIIFAGDIQRRFGLQNRARAFGMAGLGLVSLLMGSLLLVYRESFLKFSSIQVALGRFFMVNSMTGEHGYTLQHFWTVFRKINCLLAGRGLFNILRPFDPYPVTLSFANWAYPAAFWAAVLFLLSKPGRAVLGKKGLFLVSISMVMFALSPIGPPGGLDNHFFFLYPLPVIIIAAAIPAAFQVIGPWRRAKTLLSLFLVWTLAAEAITLGRYLSRFFTEQETTFRSFYSNSIYKVAEWLKSHNWQSGKMIIFGVSEEIERHLYYILPDSNFKVHRVDYNFGTPVGLPVLKEIEGLRLTGYDPFLFVRSVTEIHPAHMADILRRFGPYADFNLIAQINDSEKPAFEIYSLQLKPGLSQNIPAVKRR